MVRKKTTPQGAHSTIGQLKVQPRPNRSVHRGVTFMEILVVVAVLLLLLAMLFPSLGKAREQARRILCQNNLRQWGTATQYYRDDNNDYLPTEGTSPYKQDYTWFNVLPPYLNAPPYRDVEGQGKNIKEFPELHMWICPSKNLFPLYKSETGMNQFHYAMNQVLDGVDGLTPEPDLKNVPIRASLYAKRPNTVLMFDVYSNVSRGDQRDARTKYHKGIANVLMLSGAVESFRGEDFVVDGDFDHPVPIWNHPHMYWGYTPKQK